ncbi:carboxypeptidase-like regulatory domain-containing protein [Gemmata sp. JC673]|uniref:Carboxypeptidase-like regulatory domain-containing protein n=1 Tax=Gemmata algarum TaxID=2975278 RepID=A0ABU5F0D7_9BACT|nr:carboxypeptidase-like regulatory domain-containing protein [Gemmata algarum]MDY3560674.1 carboxypeptidase-like regulatory domain-containing protein [Gemmata algarum]
MSHRFSAPLRALGLLLLASVGPLISGCGGGDAVEVKKVIGRVTYKGEPLGGALVMFKPKGGSRVASGTTNPDGSFELVTSGATRNGAMPGDYDVLISKVVEVDAKGNVVEPAKQEYNPAGRPQERTKQKSVIPEKYNAPKAPLLSATVTDKDNTFAFELTD